MPTEPTIASAAEPGVPAAAPSHAGAVLLLTASVLASATAAPLLKATMQDGGMPPCRLAAARLLLAALALTPLAIARARRSPEVRALAWPRLALLPGLALAAHFVAWNLGIQRSTVADAALIGNLTPIVMPFVLAVVVAERLTPREVVATVVAIAGLAARAAMTGVAPRSGDILCIVATVFYALYIAVARRYRALPSVWPYVVCVYAVGGLACGALSLAIEPWTRPSGGALVGVAALVLLPTIVGHSALNAAMRRVRGQVVALTGLLAAPLAAVIAWLAWGERPDAQYVVAFVAVAIALMITAWPRRDAP